MYLAIFGDLHGKLDEMYEYVQRWEQKNKVSVAAILQTGDLGVFHFNSNLDKATQKFVKNDPSELGCASYIAAEKIASHLTVFVRGNHEDFDFLSTKGYTYIDPYAKIQHLDSGKIFTINNQIETVRISGLGGISPGDDNYKENKHHLLGRYFSYKEVRKLLAIKPEEVDILLFHEAPIGYGIKGISDTGSKEITSIIEHLQPHFALYGHYKNPPEPFYIGKTLCVGTNYKHALHLPDRDGAMGIIDTNGWKFSFVTEKL